MSAFNMKERPILFSGLMVRALLDGRKTQTRRVVNERWLRFFEAAAMVGEINHVFTQDPSAIVCQNDWDYILPHCPYGRPGDRLWVRETFFDVRPHRYAPLFAAVETDFIYRADYDYRKGKVIGCHHWSPSIFCPRQASRVLLEIVAVRVERLNEISLKDAIAEGCPHVDKLIRKTDPWHPREPIAWYFDLWGKINGPHSCDANPWVWVVEFKRVEVGA